MLYHPYVFCLNPKMTANYRKSFVGMNKTDLLDAFVIADFARVGRIETDPWCGSQFLALQCLTRHRLHLVEALTCEKTYIVSNMFLKFSELQILPKDEHPFCDNYGVTASSVLMEFFSMEDIINTSPEELVSFLGEKSKNRIRILKTQLLSYRKQPEILIVWINVAMSLLISLLHLHLIALMHIKMKSR